MREYHTATAASTLKLSYYTAARQRLQCSCRALIRLRMPYQHEHIHCSYSEQRTASRTRTRYTELQWDLSTRSRTGTTMSHHGCLKCCQHCRLVFVSTTEGHAKYCVLRNVYSHTAATVHTRSWEMMEGLLTLKPRWLTAVQEVPLLEERSRAPGGMKPPEEAVRSISP